MSLDTRQIERDVEAAVGADPASIAERADEVVLEARERFERLAQAFA